MSTTQLERFFDGLVAAARLRPDGFVVSDGARRSLTYAELFEQVDVVASRLHECGWQRVALRADDGPAWIVADLTMLALGVTAVPVPTFFSDEQCAHVLRRTGAQGLLATGGLERVAGVDVEPVGGVVDDLAAWRVVNAPTPAEPSPYAKVTFTSGTTGAPKDVALTAEALLEKVDALVVATRARSDDVHLCALPLSVLLENVGGVYRALASGGSVVVPPAGARGLDGSSQVDGARLAETLERSMATVTILVPAMLEALVDALVHDGGRLPHLRFVGVGGAPVAPSLLDRAWDVGVPAYQGYGLSEAASVVAVEQPGARRRGTVGRALGHRVRTAPDGELLVDGVRGVGRLDDPGAAERTTTLATGDLGHVDADGFVSVLGRKRDVVVTSFGRNVSPAWVETHLVRGPVRQAAVFGHGRAQLDALLVVDPDASDAEIDAAVAAAADELPDYARLGAWVRAPAPFSFVDGTLTRSGTPDRERLAERYAALLAALRDAPALPSETLP